MLMLDFPTTQHLCTGFFERQRIAVSRIIHIQHGGAVARDGDSLGLVGVISEVGIVAAGVALAFIIVAFY